MSSSSHSCDTRNRTVASTILALSGALGRIAAFRSGSLLDSAAHFPHSNPAGSGDGFLAPGGCLLAVFHGTTSYAKGCGILPCVSSANKSREEPVGAQRMAGSPRGSKPYPKVIGTKPGTKVRYTSSFDLPIVEIGVSRTETRLSKEARITSIGSTTRRQRVISTGLLTGPDWK